MTSRLDPRWLSELRRKSPKVFMQSHSTPSSSATLTTSGANHDRGVAPGMARPRPKPATNVEISGIESSEGRATAPSEIPLMEFRRRSVVSNMNDLMSAPPLIATPGATS